MKYLTFFLGDEEYAVDILSVQEIVGLLPITRIPRAPPHVRGVANLRGRVVPIVDIRSVLGLDASADNERCVIVLRVGDVQGGIVVDGMSAVIDIPTDQVVAPPAFGHTGTNDVVMGLATTQGRLRLLIDAGRVLDTREADVLQSASAVT